MDVFAGYRVQACSFNSIRYAYGSGGLPRTRLGHHYMTSPTATYSASVPSASVVCSCCLGAVLCNSIDSISSGLWGTVQGSWAFFTSTFQLPW